MPGSGFDDLLIINPARIAPASPQEVEEAESELGVRLPSGYAQYVQRLGAGILGQFVDIYVPGRLPAVTREWRARIQEYWFWDTTGTAVTPESLQRRGVVLGDTVDGDELCFDPARPDALVVLPRDDDRAYHAGSDLLEAVEWMLSGSTLSSWVEGWTFEASSHRSETRQTVPGRDLTEATDRFEALRMHAHVVDLGSRKTYFMPSHGGRLSLYQLQEHAVSMDFTYDVDADPRVINDIVAAVLG